jgi:hypothetical protein
LKYADAVVAAVWLVAMLFVVPGSLRLPWGVLSLAWIGLAARLKLSRGLTSALLVLAVPCLGHDLSAATIWGSAFGVAAWCWIDLEGSRWRAMGASVLWGMTAVWVPGVIPLTLAGFFRLGYLYRKEYFLWALRPGLAILATGWALRFRGGHLLGDLSTFQVPEHYQVWVDSFGAHLLSLHLWTVLPWVGLFEVAQHQPGDLRVTWRNLPIIGMLLCVLFLPPATGWGLMYLTGFPLCGVMLTRWSFALPSGWTRWLLWLGLVWGAVDFVLRGAAIC